MPPHRLADPPSTPPPLSFSRDYRVRARVGSATGPSARGRGRLGVWTDSGILDRFSDRGLEILWRAPIRSGYAGPAVSGGRVFVSDFSPTRVLRGTERILALDETTGRVLWTREWEASYVGMLDTWATGPGATATVDGDRVTCSAVPGRSCA